AFIVPLTGSPCTHTRVSKPSTASAPWLEQAVVGVEARAAQLRDRGLDRHVVAEPGRNQKTRAGADQRMAAEVIGLEIVPVDGCTTKLALPMVVEYLSILPLLAARSGLVQPSGVKLCKGRLWWSRCS